MYIWTLKFSINNSLNLIVFQLLFSEFITRMVYIEYGREKEGSILGFVNFLNHEEL